MGSPFPAIVAVLALGAQDSRVIGDAALFDILRDAQATNLAALKSGRMSARVSFTRAASNERADIEATVDWDGNAVLWKYRIAEPTGLVTSRRGGTAEVGEAPWRWMLRREGELLIYDPFDRTLSIDRDRLPIHWLLDVTPMDSWFRCCPPQTRGGRPWSEMIGPNPAFPQDKIESYEVRREGADFIKQIRSDKNGGRAETTFSMKDAGNVVATSYVGPGRMGTRGRYEWGRTASGVVCLKSCVFEQTAAGRPSTVVTTYRLDVTEIDLSKPSGLTRAAFLRNLPEDITIEDRIAKKVTRPKPGVDMTGRLRELAPPLRQGRFVKK